MWGWLIGGAILVGAGMAPALAEGQRRPPDQRRPAGQMLRLSQGQTHARWSGPARGPVAVLVHGLTSPLEVWDQIADGLAATGYRVLAYDLYGRGLSDAPSGAQNLAFHTRQLGDLLASQGLAEDVTLFGFSMGGAIAAAYAAANTQQIKRLVLIAPAGIVPAVMDGPTRFAVGTPVLGDWAHLALAPRRLRAGLSEPAPAVASALWAAKTRDVNRQGLYPAVLSSLRHSLTAILETDHRALGRADVPVHALWGEDDADIPVRGLGQLAAWNRNARQEVIPGADHGLPYTHAADIIARLRPMLRED
jgi:pimeloyl-ACP methyl ester carboxylesterase